MTLRARWLGRVRYGDALVLQRALMRAGPDAGEWLLLLEHLPVYTLGLRADPRHVLVEPGALGAELVRADRGGDVTYHGPGQLTGYPIVNVPMGPRAIPCYVHGVEQLVIDVLADLGLPGAGRLAGHPGVWIDPDGAHPRKVCAIGVRVSRGRSMHGFALNVDPDLAMFERIVPCGIPDKAVTSLAAEGLDVGMAQVVDAIVGRAARRWGGGPLERQDVAWRVAPEDLSAFSRGAPPEDLRASSRGAAPEPPPPAARARPDRTVAPVRLLGRLAEAGVATEVGLPLAARKPDWLRARVELGPAARDLRRTLRSLELVTVCEEAGCPNLSECWAEGTATFLINGDRCTRACGFCLVDTRKPVPPDPDEAHRVATAVVEVVAGDRGDHRVGERHAGDGGAAGFAATIAAIRAQCPDTAVEVLIPDCKGEPAALRAIFEARPDVLNHNLETVARLQRAVRPSASYARSLAVLARAKAAGLTTKSGMILGMGETEDEVLGALADLRGVGVDIVTLGQYLRPTARHLPVARWWPPEAFERLRTAGEALGIPHVEASPLTRSSYHARQAAASASDVALPVGARP